MQGGSKRRYDGKGKESGDDRAKHQFKVFALIRAHALEQEKYQGERRDRRGDEGDRGGDGSPEAGLLIPGEGGGAIGPGVTCETATIWLNSAAFIQPFFVTS